jgi:TldD protein
MNAKANGACRRESYKYEPTSRMSNTFIAAGNSTHEEIIAATKLGLYAASMGGGSVNPATGEFNFSVSEAYIIRDGKIAEPVRGATLIGSGADILMKIDMVGNNLQRAQGMCGSVSGSIPADVGQPTIRVSEILVGGRGGVLK